jgi:hypothetical protein
MLRVKAIQLPIDQGNRWWGFHIVVLHPGDGQCYRVIGVRPQSDGKVDLKLAHGPQMSDQSPEVEVEVYDRIESGIPDYVLSRPACQDVIDERDEARAIINAVAEAIDHCHTLLSSEGEGDEQYRAGGFMVIAHVANALYRDRS